jgi:hypothetical protein
MADVSYRFSGIPDGVEASVEDVTDPGVEVDTVTGTISGYGDVTLPVGDYVAIWSQGGYAHRTAGDLAARTDSDNPDSYAAAFTSELGYAERVTSDTTTNTSYAASTSNKISGLSVTLTGEGLPVLVEFYCPQVLHSVTGDDVGVVLLVNGAVTGGQFAVAGTSTASADLGASLVLRRRLVLADGDSTTFEVGKFAVQAGTATYVAGADYPMHLAVTR